MKNPNRNRKRSDKSKIKVITPKQITLLKKSISKNLLCSTKLTFKEAHIFNIFNKYLKTKKNKIG